ncbi:MAG: hypothetical protein MJ252_01270 [archaeon]|nr:hypothetical protein [archaeon]
MCDQRKDLAYYLENSQRDKELRYESHHDFKEVLRKQRIEYMLLEKRFDFIIFQNDDDFTVTEELNNQTEEILKSVQNQSTCSAENVRLRNDRLLVKRELNFLLKTEDPSKYKNLLEIFISWSFQENYILQMMANRFIMEKLFNKSFIKFKDDTEITEKTLIILNHFILAQCNDIRNDLLRTFYEKYLEILKEEDFSAKRSIKAKSANLWGIFLIMKNFDLSEYNILELKQLILRRSLFELREIIGNTNIADTLRSNLVKVIMLILYKFLLQKSDPDLHSIFNEQTVIQINNLVICVFDKYLTFEHITQYSMRYDISELIKLSLDVIINCFNLKEDMENLILSNIDKDKFAELIKNILKYIKDNPRWSEIIEKFFDFLGAILQKPNDQMNEILLKVVEKGIRHFEVKLNKLSLAEILFSSSLYKNFPLQTVRKIIHEAYVIEKIITGLETNDYGLKIVISNLIINMMIRYNTEGKSSYIREKFNKKNLFSVLENNLISPNQQLNENIRRIFTLLGSTMLE